MGAESPKQEQVASSLRDDDDEPDDWSKELTRQTRDKRIFSTGCAVENTRLNDCYYEKKDWRACKAEMEAFRECWKRQGNEERTETKNA